MFRKCVSCRSVGAGFCICCVVLGATYEASIAREAALCAGGIKISDLKPSDCGDGLPDRPGRTVTITALSTGSGTVAERSALVISIGGEDAGERVDRRFAASTFVDPLTPGATWATIDRRTPKFIMYVGETVPRQIG
jgi:hypothetical protein